MTVLLATTLGCAPNSQRQLVDAGRQPLSAEDLLNLVNDRALRLTAIDFDAQVLFRDGGKLTAHSRTGETDSGSWDITTDNRLCLDFRTWYFGDLQCYTVFPEKDAGSAYLFFTANGARYYTGSVEPNIPKDLASSDAGGASKPASYLKERRQGKTVSAESPSIGQDQSAAPAPPPSKQELKRLTIATAKNCPGCDFSGVDFSQADLAGANLSGAKLVGADLSGANLRRANLSGADLQRAVCRGANLPGANLGNANLTLADFSGANLIHAKLNGAATKGAIFTDALTEGVTGLK